MSLNLCVMLVLALLVLTKLCDVLSTIANIRHPDGETNPIARRMMRGMGMSCAAWLVFAVAMVIVGVSAWMALEGGSGVKASFIVVGVAISVVQAAVAHHNWTRRPNAVSRLVMRLHAVLARFRGG